MNSHNPLLVVEGLYKIYQTTRNKTVALRGVNLVVKAGESVAIVGPSGSGKTTLLLTIGGIIHSSSGTILFKGQDLTKINSLQLANIRAKDIGFVFQTDELIQQLSVFENVFLRARFCTPSIAKAKIAAEKALEEVDVVKFKHRKPSQLSRGQRQKVAIARAISTPTSLLLVDEPTGNLDEQSADEILDLLHQLKEHREMALLIVTHSERVTDRTDRILEIEDGTIAGVHNQEVSLEALEKTRHLALDDTQRLRIPREALQKLGFPKVFTIEIRDNKIILKPAKQSKE